MAVEEGVGPGMNRRHMRLKGTWDVLGKGGAAGLMPGALRGLQTQRPGRQT